MGNSHARSTQRRRVLACEECGRVRGVRRRLCRYTVTFAAPRATVRQEMPYCPPPALCCRCFHRLGGTQGVHDEECRTGALVLQAEEDEKQARYEAGDYLIVAAWGDYHAWVSAGMVRIECHCLIDPTRPPLIMLVPKDSYDPGRKGWLSDYPEAVAP